MDYGRAEEAWSQGGADESTGRDGVQRLEVELGGRHTRAELET